MKSLPQQLAFVLAALSACRSPESKGAAPSASDASAATAASSSLLDGAVAPMPSPTSLVDAGPHETVVTWGTLRWQMDRPTALGALRAAKFTNVVDTPPTKAP